MSIEAIRQVTETEQANKQSRAAAEAEARQLVLDAERNGTELLKKVRSDAAEQGKDLLRQAEERAVLRAQEIAQEAEAESRRQREQAEQCLYQSPAGPMELVSDTKKIRVLHGDAHFKLQLKYSLIMNGMLVSDYDLTVLAKFME